MRVVVTGGSGLAGRSVVQELSEHGYHVTSVDRAPPAQGRVPHRLVDLSNLGETYGCLAGAEAVVHLAAIPRPGIQTDDVVFRTNVMSTYNVLEAATRLGIGRVVLASSKSVLGFPFFHRPLAPSYVPIDEDHPRQPQDSYALSKLVSEEIVKAFVRRGGMTAISLRLAWIHTPETFAAQLRPLWDDPAAGASNLWGYVDSRDVGQACRLALQAHLVGHEAFFIAAPNTFMRTPTLDLVRRFYPETEIRSGLQGHASLLSSARASRSLGYRARYTWEDYPEGSR